MTSGENLFNFFESTADGLREHEEDVNKGGEVEGTKDEVCFPANGLQTRGDTEGKSAIEEPVGGLKRALEIICKNNQM